MTGHMPWSLMEMTRRYAARLLAFWHNLSSSLVSKPRVRIEKRRYPATTGYLRFLLFELKGLAEFGGGHTGTELEYAAEVKPIHIA